MRTTRSATAGSASSGPCWPHSGSSISGAGFSGFEAYRAFTERSSVGSDYYVIAYAVLGFVLIAEGTSWLRAFRQVSGEAAKQGRGRIEYIRISSDPSVKNVAGEDTTAIIGVFVAAAGIALHQVTGNGCSSTPRGRTTDPESPAVSSPVG